MLFSSFTFILLFLPITIIGYYIFNKYNYDVAKFFLLIMSCVFYGSASRKFLVIFMASILINYFTVRMISRNRNFVWLGVTWNIALIFVFKYYNFFAASFGKLLGINHHLISVILPLGISFYTFQQIAFLIDSSKRQVKISLLNYSLFVAFFPQLVAGPIVRYEELVPQFDDVSKKVINYDNLYYGIARFIFGLSKKVLIADSFGRIVDWGFLNVNGLTSADSIIIMLAYTMQIFFDFSGYSDMAIGIAKMLNIDLPENFRQPYCALSIEEFWGRWHLTLTRFLREYVYIPLGGNRKGKTRQILNILIVFLVSGIWHGANWNFILWGVLHGMLDVVDRLFSDALKKIYVWLRWIITFSLINVLWLLFRSESITQWITILKRMFVGGKLIVNIHVNDTIFMVLDHVANVLGMSGQSAYLFAVLFVFMIMFIIIGIIRKVRLFDFLIKTESVLSNAVCSVLLVACLLFISQGTEFIYFNF